MALERKKFSAKNEGLQGTFNSVKKYFKEQEKKIVSDQKKQFTWFVLGFIIFYLVLTGIVFPFQDSFKAMTAGNAQTLLSLQGIRTETLGIIPMEFENAFSFTILGTNINQQINIIWLCTGILEIIVLCGAILASFGVSWRKKLWGCLIAIIAGYVFNLLRIWITLNIIITQNIEVIEFTHDLLFRFVLFFYIIIVYVLWFQWAKK
jgi:exosortase/archaeosortase family protein